MPTLDEVTQFVHENLESPTTTKNGTHFHARCPVCGDSKKSKSKKRFHIQYRNDEHTEWNCFNCHESGNIYTIYSLIKGIDYDEAFKFFNKYNPERNKKRLTKKTKEKKTKKSKIKYEDLSYILNDCISVNDEADGIIQNELQKKLKDFIKKRKIKQKLYVAYKGDYKGRIIIPIFYKDKLVYFQGRRINKEMEPKYLNPKVNKSHIILNKEKFEKDKYIVACEGVLDADSGNCQFTTINGKELTKDFIKELYKHTDKKIILVMDNDEDGIKKLKEYIEDFPDLLFFVMPDEYMHLKDLNDILVNINITNMYEFVVKNSFTNVKAKAKIMFRKG